MNKKTYKIYKITNTINDKIYVGQTIRRLSKRFYEHCRADSLIGRAIKKYGIDNFTIEEICRVYTKDEANIREAENVDKLDCYTNGYNLTETGYVDNICNCKFIIDFKDTNLKLDLLNNSGTNYLYIQKILTRTSKNFKVMKTKTSHCHFWKDIWSAIGSANNKRTQISIKKILTDNNLIYKKDGILVLNEEAFCLYYCL